MPDPDWPTCQAEPNCTGVRLGLGNACLAHRGHDERLRILSQLGPGADVDVRGTPFTEQLLKELFDAVRDPGSGKPHFGRARFDQAEFSNVGQLVGTFRGNASFRRAVFNGPVEFFNVTFATDAQFHGTRFGGEVRFTESMFVGDTTFEAADFAETATFNCTFEGAVRFGGTSRSDGKGATFRRLARFSGVRFGGDAIFGGAARLGQQQAAMRAPQSRRERVARRVTGGVEFHNGVSFNEAKFQRKAEFQGARFFQAADFERVTFSGPVWFTDCTWSGIATFDGATFEDRAGFVGATFKKESSFAECDFQSIDFHDATWPSGSNLGPCVARELDVSAVRVNGPFTIQCRGLEQVKATNLHCADKLSLQLDGAIIVDAPAIRSAGALTFEYQGGNLTIVDAAFDTPSTISSPDPPRARPRVLMLRKVDATNLTLAGLRLGACRFAGCYNRDRLRVEGPPRFTGTPDGLWTKRHVLAEEHLWRAQYDRRPKGWFPEDSRHPTEGPPERPSDGRTSKAARAEAALVQSIYRDLRKGREDAKDEPGATDFYFGEMELRRAATPARSWERVLLTAYWAVAGYGLRATRALASLLVVLVLGTVGFWTIGFAQSTVPVYEPVVPSQASGPVTYRQVTASGPRPGLAAAIDHSVDTATSLLRATTPRPLTAWGRVFEIAIRLLGPLLLGLAVLALRTRVKR